MRFHGVALMGLLLLGSGCMEQVRASSRSKLTEKQSKVVLTGTADDAARRLTELFSRRKFLLADRQVRKDGASLYLFKGQRSELTSVSSFGYGVSGDTYTVGSAFYARLTPQTDGTTQVELFGKPTLDGHVVCGEQDPAWVPRCEEEVLAGGTWNGLDLMTGREEAETLRGMLVEMELENSGGPGSRVFTAGSDEPAKPSCVASELPEWRTSNAVEKKRLLEKCRAPDSEEGPRAVESL
ncbi:hypothetical protein CYFUS_001307 [Cystobacter fuscus]|uniref:Lipoprotein n=1 Tax=Cystobacter fuscus TaxID=43 RepID=A0A250IX83_9BACT|nr:hypothetical protein [Cystobacter fuscus]ATB35893.1 hypothetical protein CYFUS_001307 [Cystobacter fuscus]